MCARRLDGGGILFSLRSIKSEGLLMYGLIGRMIAVEGKRDELIGILLEHEDGMAGCRNYIVARDPTDANAVWITEVWESAESHKASLNLPSVQAAIGRAMPIIAAFDQHFETEPVGGIGLK
jgi:quinol monooxygenase YgiN